MSNVSNRHTVVPFIAGESKPLAEQRLAKIGYKQTAEMTKKGEKALPSICVSVPPVDRTVITGAVLESLMPYIVTLVEDAQDGIIRAANDASGGTLQIVTDEMISLEAVIAFLAAKNAGDRISKESIAAWFSAHVEDNLSVLVADKLGFSDITPDNQATIDKHTAKYLEIVQMLAGKGLHQNSLGAQQKNAIRLCVKLAEGSAFGQKLADKLAELEKITDPALKMVECLELSMD